MLARKVFESPEVYLIEVPFQNVALTETNVYVIRDQDDVLIVDMGSPTEEAAAVFTTALEELNIDPVEARYFFTHMHFDHSGLAQAYVPPEATIYINELELMAASPLFARKMNHMVQDRLEEEGMDPSHASEICATIEIATPLDDGSKTVEKVKGDDTIMVGRYPFQVVDLPGHTRGMMGLFQPDSGICFSGDQLLFIITPTTGLFLDGSDSLCAYERSQQRLMSLPITMLFHSHGDIRPDFRERAERIIRHKAKRVDDTVDVVRSLFDEMPGDLAPRGVDVVRAMRWKIPFDSIDECEPHQQWLIYTQGIAILDHLVVEGRIERIAEPAVVGNASVLHRYSPALLI